MTIPPPENRPYDRLRGSALIRSIATNLGAQGGALASVAVASLMVARVGGPTVVGEYALVRVLPWLFGVVLSCGLPTASAFFLAGDHAGDLRLRPTLSLMAVVGSVFGMIAWLVCAEPFQALFFKQMSRQMITVMAIAVATQLLTVTAKGCCQGSGDITGANLVIVAEELWFVFCYPAVLMLHGDHGANSVVTALVISGGLSTLTGFLRLRAAKPVPSPAGGVPPGALAKRVAAFGTQGQLGNLLWLMNLRLDFILIAVLAGPAELGIYAVASKFAELMRLVPTAINYVLYPRFANLDHEQATAEARKLLPRAAAITLLMAPFLAAFCYVALPVLYGEAFRPAVVPAEIIIIGLSIEGGRRRVGLPARQRQAGTQLCSDGDRGNHHRQSRHHLDPALRRDGRRRHIGRHLPVDNSHARLLGSLGCPSGEPRQRPRADQPASGPASARRESASAPFRHHLAALDGSRDCRRGPARSFSAADRGRDGRPDNQRETGALQADQGREVG